MRELRGANSQQAIDWSAALIRGGVTGIEITYSTPNCCDAIKAVKDQYADAAVGVGTVRTVDQLIEAHEAGATYAVSPHFDADIVACAVERGIPMLPGAITPTEVIRAHEAGASVVKLFPGSLVGPSYAKALKGPLPEIPLMPTGGVSVSNMAEWFAAGVVAVGMGGNLAKGTANEVESAAHAVSEAIATHSFGSRITFMADSRSASSPLSAAASATSRKTSGKVLDAVRPAVRGMRAYAPGEQTNDALKLNTNECLRPMSPLVRQTLAEFI